MMAQEKAKHRFGYLTQANAGNSFFRYNIGGIITDPLQRKLGLNIKKLNKVLDSTEELLLGEDNARLMLKDHYIARIFDLLDWTQIIMRAAR